MSKVSHTVVIKSALDQVAHEIQKQLQPEGSDSQLRPVDVAMAVRNFVIAEFGCDADSYVALEGLLLAMGMLGGPGHAAQVISYCSPKVA